jgi:hypothetical protein
MNMDVESRDFELGASPNWNGGILEYWKNGFWDTGVLGLCIIVLTIKLILDNIL